METFWKPKARPLENKPCTFGRKARNTSLVATIWSSFLCHQGIELPFSYQKQYVSSISNPDNIFSR